MTAAPSDTDGDRELLAPGTAIGEYIVDRSIGAGGFARVYAAHHPVLASIVAIKVLTRALALDESASQRFIREAQAARRIEHPNVVGVLGFGWLEDGRAYQVMELVDGPALDAHLETHAPLPIDEALAMLEAIAQALDAAHTAGIVHRDLKPANVLLARGGSRPTPRLADFGIAKALEPDATPHLTQTGTTLGTPTYMSPEQALGRSVGPASDIYSFGVVAYELLSGVVPFEGESPFATMMMHVQTPPAPASTRCAELGDSYDAALAWMLSKHPGDRPSTIAEAMTALRGDQPAPRRAPGRRRWPVVLGGLGATAAGVVLAAAMGLFSTPPTAEPPRQEPVSPVVPAPPITPPVATQAASPASDPGRDGALQVPPPLAKSNRAVKTRAAPTRRGPPPDAAVPDPDSIEPAYESLNGAP